MFRYRFQKVILPVCTGMVKNIRQTLLQLLGSPISFCGGLLCAATQLKVYLNRYPKDLEAPLISCGGKPIQYPKALAIFKKWCSAANVDKKIGFHSLRRGSATYMDRIKIPLHHIQQSGDWQSLCVLNYLSSDISQHITSLHRKIWVCPPFIL